MKNQFFDSDACHKASQEVKETSSRKCVQQKREKWQEYMSEVIAYTENKNGACILEKIQLDASKGLTHSRGRKPRLLKIYQVYWRLSMHDSCLYKWAEEHSDNKLDCNNQGPGSQARISMYKKCENGWKQTSRQVGTSRKWRRKMDCGLSTLMPARIKKTQQNCSCLSRVQLQLACLSAAHWDLIGTLS